MEIGDWGLEIEATGRADEQNQAPSIKYQASLVIFALLLVFTLAACGGITQTAQTERYTVALTLDSASFGERTATIAVNDRSGQPATVDQVVFAPVMPAMGMADPEMTVPPTAPGRYQVKGEFFSMIGEWHVNVRVSAAGKDDLAQFVFQVQQ